MKKGLLAGLSIGAVSLAVYGLLLPLLVPTAAEAAIFLLAFLLLGLLVGGVVFRREATAGRIRRGVGNLRCRGSGFWMTVSENAALLRMAPHR